MSPSLRNGGVPQGSIRGAFVFSVSLLYTPKYFLLVAQNLATNNVGRLFKLGVLNV